MTPVWGLFFLSLGSRRDQSLLVALVTLVALVPLVALVTLVAPVPLVNASAASHPSSSSATS